MVLKFGGTSVSSASNWRNIAQVLRERIADGLRPVVVHSALSGITDRLELLLADSHVGTRDRVLTQIEAAHRELCVGLGIELPHAFTLFLSELRDLCKPVAVGHTLSDKLRAQVMAMGELLATTLGAAFLNAQGLKVSWVDVRQVLRAEQRQGATLKAGYLSATCNFSPDLELKNRWAALDGIVITQGFIASNAAGDTVLLGRGGSDTSGSYLAAKLQAVRLEIWTDVPGLFSANPQAVPSARLLRALHYDEAQEIASNGAKVLHPRCILPVRQYEIPLHIYATQAPGLEGTIVSAKAASSAAQVKAIAIKKGITLVSMESPGMWHQVGFLADAFQIFKQQGLSIDLVSTSETNVTVSLDAAANSLDSQALARLEVALAELCRVEILGPCASLSLLGHNIRDILHELGAAFELFQDQKIHLVTQAANDLNFTFVMDESGGERLVQQLHERLIQRIGSDTVLGPTWLQLFPPSSIGSGLDAGLGVGLGVGLGADAGAAGAGALGAVGRGWWQEPSKRQQLLEIARRENAAFVYDTATLDAAVQAVKSVKSIDRWAYAMKANGHADILRRFHAAGLMLECVSPGEVSKVLTEVPGILPSEVLFTPNFAPRVEYEFGFLHGVRVTLDNLYPLKMWPEVFRGREIFLRIDPGFGSGHHQHVRTGGVNAKFGVPLSEADELMRLARSLKVRVTGLHAHIGSGFFEADNLLETGKRLSELAARFPDVQVVDLGGGIGVPDRASQSNLDLAALDAGVANLKIQFPRLRFWMEPGRFLVARAGVLVALMTQLKGKGHVQYVGIGTGMNSLIRPALYAAHHEVFNLTRLDEPATQMVNIVGPICETADVLAADRWLPLTQEGDVILVDNVGAYGYAMASNYNLRAPASEFMLHL